MNAVVNVESTTTKTDSGIYQRTAEDVQPAFWHAVLKSWLCHTERTSAH